VDDSLSEGSSAQYGDLKNELRIRSDPSTADVTHELVHAWDDTNDWYITGLRSNTEGAEALAYATERLLAAAQDGVGHLGRMDTGTFASAASAQTQWNMSWQTLNSVINGSTFEWDDGVPFNDPSLRALTGADVTDVANKLGLRFSASGLLPEYNERMRQKGLPANSLSNTFRFSLDASFN
jgi:hypothetical protein